MGYVNIKRESEYTNSVRDYKIFVNDDNVGVISDGEQKTINVNSGNHNI